MKRGALLVAAVCSLTACKTREVVHDTHASWERMMEQPRVDAYERSPLFDDGLAMRAPPPGTVPVDEELGRDGSGASGLSDDGGFVGDIPVPVTRALLDRGRARFEAICATCHGVLGDGDSVVAQKMGLRRPPNLHDPRYRALPPGQIYEVVSRGYGLMPSYASELSVEDRWAVVGYLEALHVSRGVVASTLPAGVRAELAKEAP